MTLIKYHQLFKFLWLCVCFAGVAYQFTWLGEGYFRYDINTNVQIQLPKKIACPVVTMCFNYLAFVRWHEVFARWPEVREKLRLRQVSADDMPQVVSGLNMVDQYHFEHVLMELMSISDLFAYSLDTDDVFEMCAIQEKSAFSPRGCHEIFDVEPAIVTLTTTVKCFTFTVRTVTAMDYMTLQRGAGGSASFMSGIGPRNEIYNRLNEFSVMYDHHGRVSRQGFHKDELFKNVARKIIGATFSYYATKRLEAPYVTKCRNYSVEGFTSRGHCFEACMNNKSLAKYDKILIGSRITQTMFQDKKLISIPTIMFNKSNARTFYDLIAKCDQLCSHDDCEEHLYIPFEKFKIDHNQTIYVTRTEVLPRVVTDYCPKFGLIEFVTDVFSALGFCEYSEITV